MERQALTQRDPDLPEDFRVYGSADDPPWKAIYLAVGLLVAGTILLFTGIGLWATDPKAHGVSLCVRSTYRDSTSWASHIAVLCRLCAVYSWPCHLHSWILLLAHSILCLQRTSRLYI